MRRQQRQGPLIPQLGAHLSLAEAAALHEAVARTQTLQMSYFADTKQSVTAGEEAWHSRQIDGQDQKRLYAHEVSNS